jgi:hypothetical protein
MADMLTNSWTAVTQLLGRQQVMHTPINVPFSGSQWQNIPVMVQTLSAKRFESGRIIVDNEAEKDLTVVVINERKDSTAALLDVASAMTGIGVVIHEAIIQVAELLPFWVLSVS